MRLAAFPLEFCIHPLPSPFPPGHLIPPEPAVHRLLPLQRQTGLLVIVLRVNGRGLVVVQERLDERVVHDARVRHHRRPDRFVLALDREVRIVDVRQAGDLRPEIEVQEALLGVIVLIISRPDLAEHVIAHGRGRADEHDARVEAQCEAALVAVDVAHGC